MRQIATPLLIAALSLAFTGAAFAGDEDEGHENWLKADDLDTGEVKVTLKAAIAQEDKINFKIDFTNQTNDWIFVKKHEIVVTAGGREITAFDGKAKPSLVLGAKDKKNLQFKVDGGGLHVDSATIAFKGFYSAASKGEVFEATEFQLPPAQNNVTAGPFDCAVTGHDQSTKVTMTKWSCTYTGDGIGYVNASQIGVKIATGAEFGNSNRKNKPTMLYPGDSTTFITAFEIEKRIVDMQFATLQLLWRDCFAESALVKLDDADWDLVLDEATTADKNK